jgi:putative holliday junction resolvase
LQFKIVLNNFFVGRILAFDYGQKRTGLAVTDPLQIIASGLVTVETPNLFDFISGYLLKESVDCFVVGFPIQYNNSVISHSAPFIEKFIETLKKKFPNIPVEIEDEHFTSKQAMQAMIDGGLKKMQRRDKAMVDKVSASIILNNYLERKSKSNLKV